MVRAQNSTLSLSSRALLGAEAWPGVAGNLRPFLLTAVAYVAVVGVFPTGLLSLLLGWNGFTGIHESLWWLRGAADHQWPDLFLVQV